MERLKFTAVFVILIAFYTTTVGCAKLEEMLPFDLPFTSEGTVREELVYVPLPMIPLGQYEFDDNGEEELLYRAPVVLTPGLGCEYIVYGYLTVNTGNTSFGYVKVRHENEGMEVLVQIFTADCDMPDVFRFVADGGWNVFALTRGDGVYTIRVLEQYDDRIFNLVFATDIEVGITNPHSPFLYPSRYVNFNEESEAVIFASRVAGVAEDDFHLVQLIYEAVVRNISFDMDLASEIYEGMVTEHVPDIDATLLSRQGICFDFSALLTAMLRSQGIPTRLEIGYVLGIFHAWVAVYVPGADWGNAAHPSGDGWGLLDPTTTSANRAAGFLNPVVDASEFKILFVR